MNEEELWVILKRDVYIFPNFFFLRAGHKKKGREEREREREGTQAIAAAARNKSLSKIFW